MGDSPMGWRLRSWLRHRGRAVRTVISAGGGTPVPATVLQATALRPRPSLRARAHVAEPLPADPETPLSPEPPRAPRRRHGRLPLAAVGAALVLASLLGLSAAVAAPGLTFLVQDTRDLVDRNVGDRQCVSTGGTCTMPGP